MTVARRPRTGPRVLYSFRAGNVDDNEYLATLLPEHGASSFRYFSWGFAVFGRYQIFHLHWPELLLASPGRIRRLGNLILLGMFVLRLVVTRTPVIRTVHNLRAHEDVGRASRWSEALLRRLANLTIFLNESGENDYRRGVVILHSSYAPASLVKPADPASPSLLFFGLLRPYKGITELIDAYSSLSSAERSQPPLVIAGAPADRDYVADLRTVISDLPGVTLVPEFLPKDALERLVSSSSMVVLPYRNLYNSGALLHALSCERPVLVPSTAATSALRREFGAWVQTFVAPLTARDLEVPDSAQLNGGALRDAMGRRSPAKIRSLHALVYRELGETPYSRRRRGALLNSFRGSTEVRRELIAHSDRNSVFFSEHAS
ncbi:glycosyltransferase [Curtobacterium sp. 9128]|uniref:glycosyltransferase n=1 Tax=Curtobacterium sp. 9128 TaxID=1793722 RepID=UPI00119F0AAC|nr:glycosyltransferase [Curtobacterium sp. 9128]